MRSFILPGAILAALFLSPLAAAAEGNICKPVGTTKVVCQCTCSATDTSGKTISEKQDLTDTSPGACGINRGWACDIKTNNGTVRGKYGDCAPAEVEQGKTGALRGLTVRPDRALQPDTGGKPSPHGGLRPGVVSPHVATSPSAPGGPAARQSVCCRLRKGYDVMAHQACKKAGGVVVNRRFCR